MATVYAHPRNEPLPPPPAASAYNDTPPLNAPDAGEMRTLWIASALIVAALVAGGVGFLIQQLAQPHDQSLVVAAQINRPALAAGWVICGSNCGDRAMSPADLHTGGCVSSLVLAAQTAGDVRNYSYDFDPSTDLEKEHLVLTVRSAQNSADELNIFRATTAPGEYPCMYSVLADYVRFASPTAKFAAPSVEVVPRLMPVATASFLRVSEPFTLAGSSHIAFMDWVTLVVGRIRTTMAFEAVIPASLGEPGWSEATIAFHEDQMIQAAAAALENAAR